MPAQGAGAQLKMRLYLEGLLVDNGLIEAFVSDHEGAPATAQLQVTPTNTLKHILPGTWVHLFVTDPWEPSPKGDLSDFKLLFEGVVIGRGFTKEGQGRAFVLQCAGPEIFWTETRQYWLNLASSGGGLVEQVAYQTSLGAGRFGAVTSNGAYGYMVSRIAQIQEDQQERFFDTLLAVIDDIGNVNPYYTNNRNRFRITDRILRAHSGKVEKLFQLALLSDFLTGLSNRVSGQTNLAELVNLLLEPILHGWVSVTAPPYVEARIFSRDAFGNIVRKANTTKVAGGQTATLFQYEMARDKILASAICKPDVYTLSPPTCNVLFPNMYQHLGFQQNLLQEPTRVIMRPTLIGRDLSAVATLGLQFMRPTELEVFTQLTRDLKQGTQPGAIQKRTPDAAFADGEGQAATFNDYDWGTNEERIRGIVYNFINLAPAPATLTLSDPGKKAPDGTRKGGMPLYLQNVASYEYYKSKFVSRVLTVSGPFNMRPVSGFPMLLVDDSAAGLNVMCQLRGKTHQLSAQGHASTEYQVSCPRLIDELDLNRPSFQGGSDPKTKEALLELARDAAGNFDFAKLFAGPNRPPIPEWFSDDYRTLVGLDSTYSSFFGPQVRVVEATLFNRAPGVDNNKIVEADVVAELVARFRRARDQGKEFDLAASFTARSLATIDQAFQFVGAAPIEYADKPAAARQIDYAKATFRQFVGDPKTGSGYNGRPEPATPSTTKNAAARPAASSSARGGGAKTPQMSGAFPRFDTKIHTGNEATDASARQQAKQNESGLTEFARYDGRPVMYDFEYRLWQASLAAAKVSPGDAAADAVRDASAAYAPAPGGGAVPLSPKAQAASAAQRKAAGRDKTAAERKVKKTPSLTPAEQAPTGDSAENGSLLPLPQPLSERQIVDLRRAVVAAWRKELEEDRGQLG